MLVALTKFEQELSSYLNRVILLAPCMIGLTDETEPDLSWGNMSQVNFLRKDLGIYAINGPTWEDDLALICTANPLDCHNQSLAYLTQPMSTKCYEHWNQNKYAYRF